VVFAEPAFLFLFLPVLLVLYHVTPPAGRNLLLVLASLLFYAVGEWHFLPILLASVALNYWIALHIDRTRGTRTARIWLMLGVASDLALLVYFKYYAFVVNQLAYVIFDFPTLSYSPVLPLGISFFTFHKISYKVDVYRGVCTVRRNPLDLALYILLFPQLIAGPIIRYHEIADQLIRRVVTRDGFAEGVRRFIVGLGKKMLVANVVARPADAIFGLALEQLTPGLAWLGLVCYTVQIYFDFSGYSDMAIGLARMFGFRFPENFHYPYVAASITDFWRRWHLSLSRWFRDYVYIPLGGNRCSPRRVYLNLVTVFFLCGLWHGANWTFVAWGLFHGLFLVLERQRLGEWLARWPRPLRHIYALAVVMIGWVLFRSQSLSHACVYFAALVGFSQGRGEEQFAALYLNPAVLLALAAGVLGSMPLSEVCNTALHRLRDTLDGPAEAILAMLEGVAGTVALGAILLLCAMAMAAESYNPFIYYRF
jgi:alginate O-acetyltransferase complex protein AlgI